MAPGDHPKPAHEGQAENQPTELSPDTDEDSNGRCAGWRIGTVGVRTWGTSEVFLVREALRSLPITVDVTIAADGERALEVLRSAFRPDI
jgi:hypothetical protein